MNRSLQRRRYPDSDHHHPEHTNYLPIQHIQRKTTLQPNTSLHPRPNSQKLKHSRTEYPRRRLQCTSPLVELLHQATHSSRNTPTNYWRGELWPSQRRRHTHLPLRTRLLSTWPYLFLPPNHPPNFQLGYWWRKPNLLWPWTNPLRHQFNGQLHTQSPTERKMELEKSRLDTLWKIPKGTKWHHRRDMEIPPPPQQPDQPQQCCKVPNSTNPRSSRNQHTQIQTFPTLQTLVEWFIYNSYCIQPASYGKIKETPWPVTKQKK
jgi:hypothetical protein